MIKLYIFPPFLDNLIKLLSPSLTFSIAVVHEDKNFKQSDRSILARSFKRLSSSRHVGLSTSTA